MFGIDDILVFLVVLGILVFVHELGHFAAAKACGIYVERFSLGMPPRLFGFRYGETDYCVGLLPIGGYVKMAGQEDAPLSEEEREKTYGHVPSDRWFNNKPIWQRAVVLVAGPFMNLVLAFGIYAFMAGYGQEVAQELLETRVGLVDAGSPASEAPLYLSTDGLRPAFDGEPDTSGWQVGDRIVSINGNAVSRFYDIIVAAVLNEDKEAVVELERTGSDGSVTRYFSVATPVVKEGDPYKAARFGIAPYSPAVIHHVFPESPAQQAGLKKDDIILTANGKIVDRSTFSLLVEDHPAGTEILLEIERDGEMILASAQTRNEGRVRGIWFMPALDRLRTMDDEDPAAILAKNKTFAQETGLHKGDRVTAVNGDTRIGSTLRQAYREDPDRIVEVSLQRSGGFFGLFGSKEVSVEVTARELLHGVMGAGDDEPLKVTAITTGSEKATGLKRKDVLLEIEGQPATAVLLNEIERTRIGESVSIRALRPALGFGVMRPEEIIDTTIEVASVQQIGVVWGQKTVFQRESAGNIVPYAFAESIRQVRQIGIVLKGLVTGNLSPELLGGPVMIGEVVTTAAQMGLGQLLEITALISVNLAVFNLLPLPVLDGGQLMFLGIEAIRRRPVSVRVMEMVQQVGFVFIIGLLVYVTFNDVSRIFNRWLP